MPSAAKKPPATTTKPATKMREVTHADWKAEAVLRFGANPLKWRFECPSCAHIATVKDWKDAGANEGEVAFSCVGRRLNAGDAKAFKRAGGPCNYTGGGLFRLNPVSVVFEDGKKESVFEFGSQS